MAIEQSTETEDELFPELIMTEEDVQDDWVQYTYETYGHDSPEYQAAKIKDPANG